MANAEGRLPRSFIVYKRFKYLKLSLLALGLAVAVYALDDPLGGRSGGTWVGYGLGGVSAFLVLWLMWFGVRRRRYAVRGAPLQGWLSAHVYLGLTLVLLVPLHSAFQFGWNVHTLAYALICVVVGSGLAGVWLYSVMPDRHSRNRKGASFDHLIEKLNDLNSEAVAVAQALPDQYSCAVHESVQASRIGGSVWKQLSGRDPDCGTEQALARIGSFDRELDREGVAAVNILRGILGTKRALLSRLRRGVRYKALTEIWLTVHIPMSIAALAAVVAHVFVVFYYW